MKATTTPLFGSEPLVYCGRLAVADWLWRLHEYLSIQSCIRHHGCAPGSRGLLRHRTCVLQSRAPQRATMRAIVCAHAIHASRVPGLGGVGPIAASSLTDLVDTKAAQPKLDQTPSQATNNDTPVTSAGTSTAEEVNETTTRSNGCPRCPTAARPVPLSTPQTTSQ